MAQVVGGSDFDVAWDDKTNRCLLLLREAADLWATQGRNAVASERVISAFLQVLAKRVKWHGSWPGRFFTDSSVEFADPRLSCLACREQSPIKSSADVTKSIELLIHALNEAADLWALGNPEDPPTKRVLDAMLRVMWNGYLAPRPPSRAYPEGL